MPLPHLASPYKGEETERHPHKTLKSPIAITGAMEDVYHPFR